MPNNIFQNGFNYNLAKPPLLPPTAFSRSNFYNGTDPSKVGFGDPFFGKAKVGQSTFSVKPGESIQERINEAHEKGGGVIYLDVGTFYLDTNLILYSNIILRGAGIFSTILDFGNGAYSVLIQGDDSYSTGTVSVTADSTTVTGSGTTFTDDMVGQSILIDGDYYEISQRNSNTEIVLSSGFSGATQSGLAFYITTLKTGVFVEQMTIQNTSTHAIIIDGAYVPVVTFVAIYDADRGVSVTNTIGFEKIDGEIADCAVGIYMDKSYSFFIETEFIYNCTSHGLQIDEGGDATMSNFGISNCGGKGALFTNTSRLSILAFTVDSNTSHGFEFVSGCEGCQFISGAVVQNGGDGVKMTATTDKVSIAAVEFSSNSGYGVNIAASSCDNNVIVGNVFTGNTTDGLNDSGSGTIIQANYGVVNNDSTGWIEEPHTWTRTGDHTFTMSGDFTGMYYPGVHLRYKQGGSFEYGTVKSASFSTGTTTVTLIANTDYAMASGAITNQAYSYVDNPSGYPSAFNYTPTGPSNTTMAGRYNSVGRVMHVTIKATVTGTPDFSNMPTLPVNISASYLTNGSDASPAGIGGYLDSGTANFINGITPSLNYGESAGTVRLDSTAGSNIVTATNPITWANNDQWIIRFSYEF